MNVTATTLPLSADSASGAPVWSIELEIRQGRADGHEHRALTGVCSRPASAGAAEITSRRSTHDRPPLTASRSFTRSPAVSATRCAPPFRSNGIAIASMNPGNGSCEMVTVDPGLSILRMSPVEE